MFSFKSQDTSRSKSQISVKGRKPLWVAIFTLVAWFVISGVAGPLYGNLSSVQKNDNADYLPKSVESQAFSDSYKAFASNANRTLPAIVLYTGEVTPSKIAAANTFLQTLASKPLVTRDGKNISGVDKKIGDFLSPGAINSFPSQDGKALLANVPFDNSYAGNMLANKKPALSLTCGLDFASLLCSYG